MKLSNFKFKNYAYNLAMLLFVAFITVGVSPIVLAATPVVALVTGTLLSFVEMPSMAFMAIQVEIWQNHIEEEIFKDNQFLRLSYNADQNVINSRVVHIPQSGGSGNVVKNRSTLPATIRKRTDTDVVYVLDEYTTDPVLIPNADTHELSYDKRNSVLGEDRDKLVETVAEETIQNWLRSPATTGYAASALPSGSVLETSGASTPATAPSATGARKKATLEDLQKMKTFLKKQKRWHNGQMYALLTTDMEAEMFPANSQITATYSQNLTEEEKREGVAYKAQGFKILTRDTVVRLDNAGELLAPEAVGSATDDEASLFWYKGAVEYAFGGVEAFERMGDPTMYGDVYSFLARSGGRARRSDYSGIALLKQAKTS